MPWRKRLRTSGLAAVALRDVCLDLAGRIVLNNVSLDVPDCAFVGVLGPNGAGKTTLMRAILGLVSPRRGDIRVLGRAPSRGDPRIGYLPQLRAAPAMPRLRGRDLLEGAFNGHRLGLPIIDRAARIEVDRVLDLVGARPLAYRPLAELSGGERQRLLLAQALLGQPRLLLLDEPLTSLDPNQQRTVVDLVRSLHAALGITVLLSAHEINPLLDVLDLVLYLGGTQAALGAVNDVITAPVLSRLYGVEIDVVRLRGRIFVLAGASGAPVDA
jgi:zinc/manganese transport system ATP-binding protein